MDPFTPELWLRLLSFFVWAWVAFTLFRAKNVHAKFPPFYYVKVTALTVFVWRCYVLWIGIEPSSANFEVTRIIVHAIQPAMYIMLGFALVIASRSPHGSIRVE